MHTEESSEGEGHCDDRINRKSNQGWSGKQEECWVDDSACHLDDRLILAQEHREGAQREEESKGKINSSFKTVGFERIG